MAEVNANSLPAKTDLGTNDSAIVVDQTTNAGALVDLDVLADKVLDRITSKTFANQVGGSSAATLLAQLSTLNSKFAPLRITTTGAWTGEQALTDFANAVNALPGGIYLGRIEGGSVCGFVLMKVTQLYGSCIFFSYTGAIANACGKRELLNGEWTAFKYFNMTAV